MLKGISPFISPLLLKVLSEMGHGDEIVFADAGFPAESIARNSLIVRADGVGTVPMLEAVLPLFPLDQYDSSNFVLMDVVPGDNVNPTIWNSYKNTLALHEPSAVPVLISREAFYERARKAYAVVATGETAQYANFILKKGVCLRG